MDSGPRKIFAMGAGTMTALFLAPFLEWSGFALEALIYQVVLGKGLEPLSLSAQDP
jgi:hypothetical protein